MACALTHANTCTRARTESILRISTTNIQQAFITLSRNILYSSVIINKIAPKMFTWIHTKELDCTAQYVSLSLMQDNILPFLIFSIRDLIAKVTTIIGIIKFGSNIVQSCPSSPKADTLSSLGSSFKLTEHCWGWRKRELRWKKARGSNWRWRRTKAVVASDALPDLLPRHRYQHFCPHLSPLVCVYVSLCMCVYVCVRVCERM